MVDTVLERSLPLSMASETDVRFTAEQTLALIAAEVPGVLVECRVWRGGCSAAMLLAQQRTYGQVPRRAFMLDSIQECRR